eukprot:9656787-Heterocapsa_arctica.AAC.1
MGKDCGYKSSSTEKNGAHAHCIGLDNSSTEENGAHAHCIRLEEVTNKNIVDQSEQKHERGLSTSHHIDETTNNAGTHHWHIVKTKPKHFYCKNLRRI